MEFYVDLSEIHYNDNDPKFINVEHHVRNVFEVDPPLKGGWFPTYMRKKLEKSRPVYRKHFVETRKMHPMCPEKYHSALLAWWTSPAGSSRADIIREMNNDRVQQRRSLSLWKE